MLVAVRLRTSGTVFRSDLQDGVVRMASSRHRLEIRGGTFIATYWTHRLNILVTHFWVSCHCLVSTKARFVTFFLARTLGKKATSILITEKPMWSKGLIDGSENQIFWKRFEPLTAYSTCLLLWREFCIITRPNYASIEGMSRLQTTKFLNARETVSWTNKRILLYSALSSSNPKNVSFDLPHQFQK